MTLPLSLLIPCKNEQHNLTDCVESVGDLAAEILVADSGSSDQTTTLARQLGCRLIEGPWNGYAAFKNWAIPQATHPWVLILDADERMTPALAAEIRELFANEHPKIDGYWISRRNFMGTRELKYGPWKNDRVCRLIRRDRCRYKMRMVHEEIDITSARSRRLSEPLLHYTHTDWDHCQNKLMAYATLDASHHFKRGNAPRLLRLLGAAPARFLRDYFLRGGFREGKSGLQLALAYAKYAHWKQSKLWTLHRQKRQSIKANIGAIKAQYTED